MAVGFSSVGRVCHAVLVPISYSPHVSVLRGVADSRTLHRVLGVESRYTQSTRHLRAHKHTLDDEDRAFDGNIPVISTIADKMSKKPKSEAEVFKLLAKMNLINEKSNVFENPQFLKLTNAVAKGYKEPQAADMAIALTLAGQRGDEALAKMIVEAKKVSSTKDVAVRLEEAQIKNWLSKEETADKVLRALKIEKDGYISLWNLLLGTWVSYVKKIEEDPYKLLLSKMRAHDSDAKIAGWIGNAKQDAVPIAEKLENVLLDSWMPKTADDIFKLLELSSRGNDLFHSPRLSTWISYVTKVKGKQADVQMYTVLRAAYGDDELARMLAASKQFALGDVAKRLEEVQHKVGLIEGKTAQRFFTNLKLNTQGDKLFESPALWLRGWKRCNTTRGTLGGKPRMSFSPL